MSVTGSHVTWGTIAMDANHQSASLLGGQDVVINFGLGSAQAGPWRLSVAHRLRVITKVLPEVLEPGYLAHLQLTPQRVWVGEPLLVVQGVLKHSVAQNTLLWDALVEAEQDCIALFYLLPHEGVLFGPKAEAWGEFNINFFHFIGDKHE